MADTLDQKKPPAQKKPESGLLTTVAAVRADSYDPPALYAGISRLLDLIGGIGRFVRPGMRVLIKPNLLSARGPERAVVTHPEVVAAIARLVREAGGSVQVGDSPAGAKVGIRRVWDNTGYSEMAAREGLELVNFEKAGSRPVAIDTSVYYIARPVLDADLVINVPKLKTHVLTLMTGAVKNMFGSVPGFRKGMYHKSAPSPRHFSRHVVDVFSAVQPGLTIMDAVLGMEGDGPASGSPRPINLLLASPDGVALDTVAADVIGLNPQRVHTTRYAAEAGLGIGWLEGIRVAGEKLSSMKIPDFKLTSNLKLELLPRFLVNIVDPFLWLFPGIDSSKCIMCGECVNSCPTKALQSNGHRRVPSFRKKLCITCWCCHEVCPEHAVFIDKSFLASRFLK